MSRHSARSLRERASRAALRMGNVVRRVALAATSGGSWGILGYAIPDMRGGDTVTAEGEGDAPVEAFTGIHIYARPAAGDNGEAILLHVGSEAEHPVIAAVRSEDARQRYVEEFGEVAPGELAISNSAGNARVLVTADGAIAIQAADGEIVTISRDGPVEPLVKRSEFNALLAVLFSWSPTPNDGGAQLRLDLQSEYGASGPWEVPGTTSVTAE